MVVPNPLFWNGPCSITTADDANALPAELLTDFHQEGPNIPINSIFSTFKLQTASDYPGAPLAGTNVLQ